MKTIIKSTSSLLQKSTFSFAKTNKLIAFYRLCRFDKPIGAMLLYWPTAWGVCLGSPTLPSLYYLSLFLMGSWTARSAGCIVNDYFDKQIDKQVQRTKSRPLASGQVTDKQALFLLVGNLGVSFIVFWQLPATIKIFTLGMIGMAGVYPLMKRYTNYPQLVLGLVFNSGVIISALTIDSGVPLALILPIYLSGVSWTMVYDTIYAYQDIEDDLKIGVKSTAIHWKDKNPKQIMQMCLYFNIFCSLSLTLVDEMYFYSSLAMCGANIYLIRILKRLNLKNKKECGQFFKGNNVYGLMIFGSLSLANLMRWFNSLYYTKEN